MLKLDLAAATALLDKEPQPIMEWRDGRPTDVPVLDRETGEPLYAYVLNVAIPGERMATIKVKAPPPQEPLTLSAPVEVVEPAVSLYKSDRQTYAAAVTFTARAIRRHGRGARA